MKLNTEILEPLKNEGFQIIEETQSSVRLDNWMVSLLFSDDKKENQVSFYVGYKYDGVLFEYVDFNYVIQLISPLPVSTKLCENPTINDWLAYYLKILFSNNYIIKGDEDFFSKLKDYYESKVLAYNAELHFSQLKKNADDEWAKKNYEKFVALISKIDPDQLPSSYKTRYAYALNKIKR